MPNIRLKRYNGAAWENVEVQTDWSQILNKPSTFTPTAHTHNGSDITSGKIDPERLGSGQRTATTFLNGLGNWETVESGSGVYLPLTGGNITGNLNVSGNVGIGTTNPSNKLTVSGGVIRSERSTAGPAFQATVFHSGSSNTNSIGYQSYIQSDVTALGFDSYGFSENNEVYGFRAFADSFYGNTYAVYAAAGSGGDAYAFYGPYGLNYFGGNVGIGIANPGAKLDVAGNIRLTGTPTTTNQARTIEFTGFDKEGTTDFSDNAYIRHTVNSGGLTGSVLEISSQNDAQDGINFITPTVDSFRHNGNIIVTGANIGSQSVSYANSAGSITNQANSATITATSGVDASNIVRRDANGYIYANHINFSTGESENPSINSFITSNGDGWSRKSNLQHVKNSIRGVADGTWGINWDSSGRNYNREWIEMPNFTGLYSPNNNAHFYPNNLSYGAWRVTGSRNGWHGLEFENSQGNVSLMVNSNSTESGFHANWYGWQLLWASGVLRVSKSTFGGGTLATVIDSTTIGSQSVNYANSAGGINTSSSASFVFSGNTFGTMNSSNLNPNGVLAKSLGASNAYWLGVWTCTIYRNAEAGLSDVYSKKDIKNIVIDGVPIYQPASLKEIEVTPEEENFFEGVKTLFEKLTIYTFNYVGTETNKPDKIGVMAQEIEEVLKNYPLLLSLLIQEVSEDIKDDEGNVVDTQVKKFLRTDNLNTLKTIMIKYIYFKVKNLEEAVKQANETIAKIKYVLINKEIATTKELA
jgi:hypothetical protein